MSVVISVANLKGGVGKSTMTIFLASAFGSNGKKVLVLDADRQHTIKSIWQLEDDPDKQPLFDLEVIAPRYIYDLLKIKADKYDLVFIDVPRSTEDKTDTSVASLITLCDAVLIPVVPSQLDVLSTIEFLKMIKEIETWKMDHDLDFRVAAFLNRSSKRNESAFAKDALKGYDLDFLDADLPDLKMFLYPSAFTSILDTKSGQNKFERFYTEVQGLIAGL
jgi:chromosome partitioning protein